MTTGYVLISLELMPFSIDLHTIGGCRLKNWSLEEHQAVQATRLSSHSLEHQVIQVQRTCVGKVQEYMLVYKHCFLNN
jgi:hypothetical protein